MKAKLLAFPLIGLMTTANAQEINLGHYKLKYVKEYAYGKQEVSKSQTGTIKGVVLFKGKIKPKNRKKLITKDKEVCGKGYKIDKVYVISPEGGIKNAVVFVKDINKPFKEVKTLTQKNCEFHPRVLAFPYTSVLRIVNEDPVKHEATGVQDFETIFKFPQPKKGMVNEVKLEKPGVVEITCSIHGWMKAWTVVTPNPYYAITDKKGRFEIRNVPAGEYTLKLWHEGFGEREKKVRVEPGKVVHVYFEIK